MRRLAALLVLLFGLLSMPALAQDRTGGPDYAAWESVASGVEVRLEAGDAPDADLEALREELAGWRAQLFEAESTNAARVETLRAQLDALGPPPAEGESELGQVAERRAELTARLADAEAPQIAANEAYNRADGLIAEIDDVLRTRQTEALLSRGPMPLNPVHWPAALESLAAVAVTAAEEVRSALGSDWQRARVVQNLPVAAALLAGAALLLGRGRLWIARVTNWIQGRSRHYGRATAGFLISLGQVALPVIGVMMVLGASLAVGITGTTGDALLEALGGFAIASYVAAWLGGRLFPAHADAPAAFALAPALRARARRVCLFLGLFVGLAEVASGISALDITGPEAGALLTFSVATGLAAGYYWLARLVRAGMRNAPEDATAGFVAFLEGLLYRALLLVAVVGLGAASVGYTNLADAILLPTAGSLALLGVFVALQPVVRDLYAWISRTDIDAAAEALVPVLVNFALAFGAMPLLALIWGMRPAELSEVSARINEGLTLGETRVTPGVILRVLLVFGVVLAVTRLFQGALKTTVLPRTRLDAGARNAITSFAGYLGIALAFLLAINAGGIDLTALAVVFGALSVGIGFGLQNVVQNFVAGIILLIERPIGEGDWIEVAGNMGIVKSISVRSTTIETFDKQQVIVPNADFISGTVTNWTRGSQIGRAVVEVGVAYGSDTRKVERILLEIAGEHPVVASYPPPGVDFTGFGASSLDFRIRAILRDVNRVLEVTTEMRHRIAERFAEEGIEIPFAQQDVWLRNPEALRPQSGNGADAHPPPPVAALPEEGTA